MTIRKDELNPLKIDGKRLYSTGEASYLMGCNIGTIRAYLIGQRIKGLKVGGNWKVIGQSIIEFLFANAPRKTFLEYPPDQVKFPQASFLMHHMVSTMYKQKELIDLCGRYFLLKPHQGELDKLWAAVRETAPIRIRKQLRPGSKYILDVTQPEAENWVTRLGIKDLFGHSTWPCQNILEDASEKRLHIEVMLVGRVTHKEIVNYMAAKYNFIITEEQLDFFARHFFNTYNYNSQDRIVYLNRLEDRTEKFHKQRAWGDSEAAKATLQIPSRVNFEETLNMVAAMATLSFRDFALGGAAEMPLAKDAAQMIFHSHRQILALEKARSEQVAGAMMKAKEDGLQTEAFEHKSEEAPSFEDLEQPGEDKEKASEAKAS